MSDKTKFILFLVFLFLASIIFGVIQIKNANSFTEFLHGSFFVAVPILLLTLYIWIDIKIYEHHVKQHRTLITRLKKENEKYIKKDTSVKDEEINLHRRCAGCKEQKPLLKGSLFCFDCFYDGCSLKEIAGYDDEDGAWEDDVYYGNHDEN